MGQMKNIAVEMEAFVGGVAFQIEFEQDGSRGH